MGIAGGVETMSNGSMKDMQSAKNISKSVYENEKAAACLMPMGLTSENVAKEFGIDRGTQDQLAFESHAKAAAAVKNGWTKTEITPYKTFVKDEKGEQKEILVDMDDGCRPETTL